MFAANTTSKFEIGTVATHTCNTAFALVGSMTRTCTDDDQADIVGVWSGMPPTCECKDYLFIGYFKEKMTLQAMLAILYSIILSLILFIAIECFSLNITNGVITYAADTTPEFEIGTVATHTCIAEFALVGDMTRTCMDDDQADIVGVWSESAPTCERNDFYSLLVCLLCTS